MKITVLMENSAQEGLVPEHGLSFYMEYRGGCYLLDAGECGAVVYNAARLGVDLSKVDKAALSHGHYDHADGFNAFFAVNDSASVYARPRRRSISASTWACSAAMRSASICRRGPGTWPRGST